MNIEDRTCLVTGGNTGIGRATAEELARRGAKVVLAGRSETRTLPVVQKIRSSGGDARFLHLDLSSLASVKSAAEAFLSWGEPLHVLINNAGVVRRRGVTEDGFEYTFAVNYLGHYLFTRLLIPVIERRILNVSSEMHRSVMSIDWDALHRRGSWVGVREYRVSKLGNVLFAEESAHRFDRVESVSLHPGLVATEILRTLPPWIQKLAHRNALTPGRGARTSVYCATAPTLVNGGYYANEQLREPGEGAHDDRLAGELWERSERWVGPFL